MPAYLLDTNILVRLADPSSSKHSDAVRAVTQLLRRNQPCVLVPQVLVEFWSVATRPVASNGLGWDVLKTRAEVDELLTQFPLLPEPADTFHRWLELATRYSVSGVRVHDLRIVAVMQSHNVEHVLTFNQADFPARTGVIAITPEAIT